jgi:hypothetical protein
MGKTMGAYEVLAVHPDRRRSLRKPRRRCEDNIKIVLHEKGWGARVAIIWLRMRTSAVFI